MKDFHDERDDLTDVRDEEREKDRENCYFYRNLVLLSVTSFLIGMILSAFGEMFGFGGLLVGLLLCVLGGVFVKLLQ